MNAEYNKGKQTKTQDNLVSLSPFKCQDSELSFLYLQYLELREGNNLARKLKQSKLLEINDIL